MQENLSLYHIFYVVGKTGNISQAAKELFISQPAISKAIQKLEYNLDTKLFLRSSRGVILTPDGVILFQRVKEAFSLLSEGENYIQHNHSREIPRLRLGTSSTLSKYVLLPYLKNYINLHPKVRIGISCQSSSQTLKLLEEEKIDIGLVARPNRLNGFYYSPLLHITDTFVASRQYLDNQKILFPDEPLTHNATFMMLDEENITRQYVNSQLKEHNLKLSHILEVTSMDLLIQFAEIGLGIACVIREFVEEQLANGTLIEVSTGINFTPREVGFICKSKKESLSIMSYFFQL